MSARLALLTIFVFATLGCYSFTTLSKARTLGKGHYQAFVAPEAFGVMSKSGGSVRPVVDLGLRYGISDDVDLGARLSTLGITLGPRIQLVRSKNPERGFDVMTAPAVAWTSSDKLAFEAPLLIGKNLGEHQLVLAPRLVYQLRFGVGGQSAPAAFAYAGGSLGFAAHVTGRLTLLPEVAALTEIYADPGFATNLSHALGAQGALGILYDY